MSVRNPLVDVIIPVHSKTRPIARAAGSVLDGTTAPIRVTVVAHNIDPDTIAQNLGEYLNDPRLRLLHLSDAIASPAGPMNFGLDHATAPFVSLLGSDDEFEKGLVDSWLAMQRLTGADVVLSKIQEIQGIIDPYPPVRMGSRTRELDPRKDRLSYRSSPLGLVNRESFPDLRFSAGLGSGEDLIYTLTLWFTSKKIAYDLGGPRYIGHGDAEDRVTRSARPLADDFAYLDELEALPWFATTTQANRTAVTVKLMRLHLFDALSARMPSALEGTLPGHEEFATLVSRLAALAPASIRLLSIADRAVIDELKSSTPRTSQLAKLLERRQQYRSVQVLIPRNTFYLLHRQAPLRTLGAGFRILRKHSN